MSALKKCHVDSECRFMAYAINYLFEKYHCFTDILFSFEAGEILVVIDTRNVKGYFNIIAEMKNILVFSKNHFF